MALQFSTTVRNGMLNQIEVGAGPSAILRIRSGAAPANCAATRSGTVLATLDLPSDWMADASGGTKVLAGTWSDPSADADGTAAHFEIMDSGGTTCHVQGTVTATGGGGDMTVDNTSFAAGQAFNVTVCTFTAPGA